MTCAIQPGQFSCSGRAADRRGVSPVRPFGPGRRRRRERVGARAYPSILGRMIIVMFVCEIVERTFASPFAKILFDFIIDNRRIVLTTIDDEIVRDDRVRLPRSPCCRSPGRGAIARGRRSPSR